MTWKILCNSILTIASTYCFGVSSIASSLVSIPNNNRIGQIGASFWVVAPGATCMIRNRQFWCGLLTFIFINKGHFSYICTISGANLCELIVCCWRSYNWKIKNTLAKLKARILISSNIRSGYFILYWVFLIHLFFSRKKPTHLKYLPHCCNLGRQGNDLAWNLGLHMTHIYSFQCTAIGNE